MNILTIRTDKPEAEVGIISQGTPLAHHAWQANRMLADTIHKVIEQELKKCSLSYQDIQAIALYKGPGSFTGLRIGASVANALASSLQINIVGETGEDWLNKSLARLQQNESDDIVVPEYGALPNITKPKK